MSEHTPGPWTFDRDWTRIPTVFGPDGQQKIASIEKHKHLPGGLGVQEDLPEREANAHMIAAAPDMLAALRECASRCRYDGDLWDNQGLESRRDASWRAAEMAEDAIVKAEGRAELSSTLRDEQ